MNLEFKHLLPDSFSPNSRVWIYQSSRLFTMNEALQLEQLLQQFAAEWKSHGDSVDAYANLFFGQFIVLMADESRTTVGGCSTALPATAKTLRSRVTISPTRKTSAFPSAITW